MLRAESNKLLAYPSTWCHTRCLGRVFHLVDFFPLVHLDFRVQITRNMRDSKSIK